MNRKASEALKHSTKVFDNEATIFTENNATKAQALQVLNTLVLRTDEKITDFIESNIEAINSEMFSVIANTSEKYDIEIAEKNSNFNYTNKSYSPISGCEINSSRSNFGPLPITNIHRCMINDSPVYTHNRCGNYSDDDDDDRWNIIGGSHFNKFNKSCNHTIVKPKPVTPPLPDESNVPKNHTYLFDTMEKNEYENLLY